MPHGSYIAGSRLNQKHKDACTCYNCQKPGHIHANCPDRPRESLIRRSRMRRSGKIRTRKIRQPRLAMERHFTGVARALMGSEGGLIGTSLRIARIRP